MENDQESDERRKRRESYKRITTLRYSEKAKKRESGESSSSADMRARGGARGRRIV